MTNPWWFLGEPMQDQQGRVLPGVEVDASAKVQHCRSCGKPVWWGRTAAGKANPFDVIDGRRTPVTHFSTCPQAGSWSKR